MASSYSYLDEESLLNILELQNRNLSILEMQAAKHGSSDIPLALMNNIRDVKDAIDLINVELSEKGKRYSLGESKSLSKKIKILIIDDDSSFLQDTKQKLLNRKADIEVLIANGGIEGLKMVTRERPDMTLLDIEMPDMNGYAVISQIMERKIPTRVIIISAYRNHVSALIRMGACDFLSKLDLTEAHLYSAIERSLELDPTIDVILSEPIKKISSLIEKLDAAYKRGEENIKKVDELEKKISSYEKFLGVINSHLRKVLGYLDDLSDNLATNSPSDLGIVKTCRHTAGTIEMLTREYS